MTATTELHSGPGLWREPLWFLLAWGLVARGVQGVVGSRVGGGHVLHAPERGAHRAAGGAGTVCQLSVLLLCLLGTGKQAMGRNAKYLGNRPLYLCPGSRVRTSRVFPRRSLSARPRDRAQTAPHTHVLPSAHTILEGDVHAVAMCVLACGCPPPAWRRQRCLAAWAPSMARWALPLGAGTQADVGVRMAVDGGRAVPGPRAESTDVAPTLPRWQHTAAPTQGVAPWSRLVFAASLSRSLMGLGASHLPGHKQSRGGTEAFSSLLARFTSTASPVRRAA